jgi:hypothetical protein
MEFQESLLCVFLLSPFPSSPFPGRRCSCLAAGQYFVIMRALDVNDANRVEDNGFQISLNIDLKLVDNTCSSPWQTCCRVHSSFFRPFSLLSVCCKMWANSDKAESTSPWQFTATKEVIKLDLSFEIDRRHHHYQRRLVLCIWEMD